VLDYGTTPRQPLPHFQKSAPMIPLASAYPGMVDDAYITAAVTATIAALAARSYSREDGFPLKVQKLLVDIRWGQKNALLKSLLRRHPAYGQQLWPAQGQGFGAKYKPITAYKPEPGAVAGGGPGCPLHWRIAPADAAGNRWVTTDVNFWKDFAAARLAAPMGTPGAWSIFGRDPAEHALLFDHWTAETPIAVSARGQTVNEWSLLPGRSDNDWWDCLVGAAVGVTLAGAMPPGLASVRQRRRPEDRPTLAQLAGRSA
jgi:hypothetical protein